MGGVRTNQRRRAIGAILLAVALASCSSDGDAAGDDAREPATEDLAQLRVRLEAAGLSCGPVEPGEPADPGMPTATSQVQCRGDGAGVQLSSWATADEADDVEAGIAGFVLCDPAYIPMTYVDGGTWLAFASNTVPDGATRRDEFEATTALAQLVADAIGGTPKTVNDCAFED